MKLRKYKERNNIVRVIVVFTILCVFALSGVFLYNSFAVFTEEKNFNVINGTIQDPGDIYFAYYVDGEITRSIPKQNTGYTLDTDKSNCTNGVIPEWDNAGWKFIGDYSNYKATDYTRTRCNLYFTKESTIKTALGNLIVNSYTPDFTKSACDDETCESHEKGIFMAEDDDGTSYYYRGSVENNYVKFAGYYWRIIRINGNGSIRMIYDGTSTYDNGEVSKDRYYVNSQFNTNAGDNMYVGYMYTSGNAHGLDTNSIIKVANDNFYTTKLTSYINYIDTNAGFCGDRSRLNSQTGGGTGKVSTHYKGYLRVSTSTPSLKCENSSDYYTVSSSLSGNKSLVYPVGLITADEILLAGMSGGHFDGGYNYQKSSINNYLAIGNGFWSITPAGYLNPFDDTFWTFIFVVDKTNYIDDNYTYSTFGIRPVISLKSTLKFTGEGTKENPFIPNI